MNLSLPLFAMMKMTDLVRTHSENNTQECEETNEWKSTEIRHRLCCILLKVDFIRQLPTI